MPGRRPDSLNRMFRRPLAPLVVALGCVPLLALVWLLAFRTDAGARLDIRVLSGLMGLQGSSAEPLARLGAHLAEPIPFALLAVALAAIALARRRPRHALVVVAVLAGATVTTQLLKPFTGVARAAEAPAIAPVGDAWPSGHTTAAVALALCFALVVPAHRRPWAAAAGAVFVLAEGFGLIVMGWHYPSDVAGGIVVAALWAALGLAALRAMSARRGAREEDPRRPGAARPAAARI